MSQFGQRVIDKKEIQNEEKLFSKDEKSPLVVEKSSEDIVHSPIYKTKALNESPILLDFKNKVFERIIKNIDLNAASKMDRTNLRREIEFYIFEFTEEIRAQLNHKEVQFIIDDIIYDMVGLGPLEILLNDGTINDIMINSPESVFVERYGKLILTDTKFRDDRHVLQIAQRIASQVGRRIDESSPMVDARLKDGSRVNIIIPPLALEGTSISIRKFSKSCIHLKDMIKNKSLSEDMYEFLKIAAMCRLNIIISGGTGAGKTTILNALSELIDPKERIVSIEDSAELKLQQPHIVRLESRPANLEGQGMVTIQDLVKNALRMRPDRIIVGECRGAETFDMLQAMNTGHDGSMSTLHANSSHEAVNRLENMVLMTGHNLPPAVIKNYIKDAVDLIIHVGRLRDGSRRILQISELQGIEHGEIKIQDIFKFNFAISLENILTGHHECYTNQPQVSEKIKRFGLHDDLTKVLKGYKYE